MRRWRFLVSQNGIRKNGDLLMIGDSPVVIDTDDNIKRKGTVFKGKEGLWDLLTRKNASREFIGQEDLKTYKKY